MFNRLAFTAVVFVSCIAAVPSLIQSGAAANTSGTFSFPANPTSGDYLVVGLAADAAPTPPAGWAKIVGITNSTNGIITQFWACSACTGNSWTWSGAINYAFVGAELNNQNVAAIDSSAVQNNASAVSATSPTISTAYQDELVMALYCTNGAPLTFDDTSDDTYDTVVTTTMNNVIDCALTSGVLGLPDTTSDSGQWGEAVVSSSAIISVVPVTAPVPTPPTLSTVGKTPPPAPR